MDLTEVIEKVSFLRVVPAKGRHKLATCIEIRTLRRGDPVWKEGRTGSDFTFLASGRVKLVRADADGRETILDIARNGSLICGTAISSFEPYCCTARAAEDQTVVVMVPRRDLFELLEQAPRITPAFLREVTCRCGALCRRLSEVASGQVDRRIALLFLRLTDELGQRRGKGEIFIPLVLSRQEIAEMCGTTVETAIRLMSRLSKEGVVRTTAGGFVVAHRDQLMRRTTGPQRVARAAPPTPVTIDRVTIDPVTIDPVTIDRRVPSASRGRRRGSSSP